MPDPQAPLSPGVLEALRAGQTLEAIKLVRASTGLGLAEAKHIIDRHQKGMPVQGTGFPSAFGSKLPPAAVEVLRRGNKLEAIRLLREHSGIGLKEAKDAVDAFHRNSTTTIGVLSPGEVPRSTGSYWWIAALVVGALAALAFFRLQA